MTISVQDRLLTPREVASYCQVSRHVVRTWRVQRLLKTYRIPGSKHFRYQQKELVAMLKKHGWPIHPELLQV